MNIPYPRNDVASTEIKAAGAFAATIAYTSGLTSITDYHDVDVFVVVTDKGTNTSVEITAHAGHDASPSVWSDLQSDDAIADGVAPLATYTAVKDITGLTAPFTLHFNAPRRGRSMRFGVKGTAADGSYSVRSIRNVR